MKKIVFLAFLLLATTSVFAQQPENERRVGGREQFSAEEIAKRNTEWMTKDLNLTNEQIVPVDSINLLYAKTQQAIFQSANSDREKIREAMKELGAKKEEALSAVLTNEQLDLYKKRMSERGNRPRRNTQ
jgi:Spy/CpxP family protein refolding chaperone